jgi:hypothetical protein
MMDYVILATATDTTGDRLGLVGKILLAILGLILLCVVGAIAAGLCVVVGPALLVVAFFAWLFGASWAGEVAGAGAVCSVVGLFFLAGNS